MSIRSEFERFMDRLWGGPVPRWRRQYLRWKYARFEPGHIFDVVVDDIRYKMTFLDYPLKFKVIERIEGRREPQTMAIMRSLVRTGDTVVEVGSCYGEFTVLLSRAAGQEGRVIAIEGTPSNFRILQANIRLNDLQNVCAHLAFVTDRAAHVSFECGERDPYAAMERLERGVEDHPGQQIQTVQLSRFLDDLKVAPDAIFMDIEGFEADVFRDFSGGYLRRRRPVLVFETHPRAYKQPHDLNFITGVLEQNDYDYRAIAGNMVCFPLSPATRPHP